MAAYIYQAISAGSIQKCPTSKNGKAGDRIRTDDHLFTKQVLYQLSYPGIKSKNIFKSVADFNIFD
jgi:hypothetical protein